LLHGNREREREREIAKSEVAGKTWNELPLMHDDDGISNTLAYCVMDKRRK
jgi:hypothetical protein